MDDLKQFNFSLKAPKATASLLDLVRNGSYMATDAQLTRFIRATAENGTVKVVIYEETEEIGDIETGAPETAEPEETEAETGA